MTRELILGIDPGMSGGIVTYYNQKISTINKLPPNPRGIYELIGELGVKMLPWNRVVAYVENVHAMPMDGRTSIFTFAKNVGWIEGALAAYDIEMIKVTPQSWQKFFGMKKSKDEKKQLYKNRLKDLAKTKVKSDYQSKVTLATADAILIGLYGVEAIKNDNS